MAAEAAENPTGPDEQSTRPESSATGAPAARTPAARTPAARTPAAGAPAAGDAATGGRRIGDAGAGRAGAGGPGPGRRRFLTVASATALAAGGGLGLAGVLGRGGGAAGRTAAAAGKGAPPLAASAAGTTLESVATLPGGSGYRRMADGPGWPLVVRTDLAAAGPRRDRARTALACFVHFTDLHIVDVQHPLRYEYMRGRTASAWRPHETLTVAGAASLVERVNALGGGPHTGRRVQFVMTTGDNTDNNSTAELEWFLTLMSGGKATPNTGDPAAYEGVQNSGDPLYWHPDRAFRDFRDGDKKLGYPVLPGFLDAAISTVTSPGLRMPWYSTIGNHDDLPGGCFRGGELFREHAVGSRKLETLPAAEGVRLWDAIRNADPGRAVELYGEYLSGYARRMRTVTPDARRAPFTPAQYLSAHLDPAYTGAGPAGHGYTADSLDGDRLYYTFPVARNAAGRDVVGISLDTTNRGGHYEGSLGTDQLRWLERALQEHRDAHVLVFSHHTSTTMRNTRPDPARPGEARHGGGEVVELLQRHPHVMAWINGHSHKNKIRAHAHRTPARSFWEITTASHVDTPQQARMVELADNGDGTLSLFTTLIESAAPARTDFADLSQTGLASLYRELAYNSPGAQPEKAGEPGDRNTELLLARP